MSQASDLEALRAAASARPDNVEGWVAYALALAKAGQPALEAQAWGRAIELRPRELRHQYNRGMALRRSGNVQQSTDVFLELSRLFPKSAAVWNTLGTLQLERGAVGEAEASFRKAISLKPDHVQARANLAAARSYRGDVAGSTRALLEAFRERPDDVTIQIQLGNNLIQSGNLETAAKMFTRALRFDRNNIDAAAGIGTVFERQGRAADARALLEPLVEQGHRNPNLLAAWGLACRRMGEAQRPISVLRAALDGPLPAAARFTLGHVLGDLYDKADDPAGAMWAHGQANQADERPYDPELQSRLIDMAIEGSARSVATKWPTAEVQDGPRMVFIVGMPRSGTSLTEQILGSHPDVFPAGEREEIPRLVDSLVQQLAPSGCWTEAASRMQASAMTDAARWYQSRVCSDAASAKVVTDKMPLNYRYLALMSRLFPDAVFVHTERDPLDTALSCYFSSFSFAYAFTNRLEWLGRWIRDHDRLQAHWMEELDAPLMVSRYEDLIAAPEARIRALLSFVDLPWSDDCMSFHRSRRRVNTASYDQVRRPLYSSSVGRAQRYRDFLGPVRRELAGGSEVAD